MSLAVDGLGATRDVEECVGFGVDVGEAVCGGATLVTP